jgi:hypothetical protein
MKKVAVAVMLAGTMAVAGQASAHGRDGDVVGALIGGAVLGAVVTSMLNPPPVVAYQQPVYQAPAYQAPAYQASDYAGPPPGYCYDQYQRAYACGNAPQSYGYGYAPVRTGW